MMCAAAICVNKSLFGNSIVKQNEAESDMKNHTITALEDGGVVIHTCELSKVPGYSGPVPLDVYVASDGVISDIKALPNSESPKFFVRAEALFNQWIGKNIGEIHPVEVDGVSGATYSSEAIKANMEAAAGYYRNASSHISSPGHSMPLKMWIALVVVLAACIVPLFVKNGIYRNVQLAANVIVLGFWSGQFLDYALMLKYLSSGFLFPTGIVAIVMLVAAFIYPLFGHPQHYCTNICPLGSAQMLAGQITKYKIKINAKILKVLDWFRKILWAALMLLLWADVATGWMDLELFQAFMYKSAPMGIIISSIFFIGLSCVVNRPYCRFVCPTGSLFKRAENIG